MTPDPRALAQILARTRAVLLDFDGPVCDIFAGYPAPQVAADLRDRASRNGVTVPDDAREESDPLALWRRISNASPEHTERVEEILAGLETEAAARAEPTPHADAVMRATIESRRLLGIVSNNSSKAITAYLDRHGIAKHFNVIVGRDSKNPDHMKPAPFSIIRAVSRLGLSPSLTVLIGDSVTDIQAAHAAGAAAVGYANKAGKEVAFAAAGTKGLAESMGDIATALRI